MKSFIYNNFEKELFVPNIINLLGAIHEYKGKQELFIEVKPDILQWMLKVARIQSTGASNRIEAEIKGYPEVLAAMHESYEYIMPRSNNIL